MKKVTMKVGSSIMAVICLATVFAGCGKKETEKEERRSSSHEKTEESVDIENNEDDQIDEEEHEDFSLSDLFEETEEEKACPVELLEMYQIGSWGDESLNWIVIDTDGDKALLIAEKIVDCVPYNNESKPSTWETCSLRTWLNEDFYNGAFTEEERQMILKTTVNNQDLPVEGYNYGSDTEDFLYILSRREMEAVAAPEEEFLSALPTQIALDHELYMYPGEYWRRDPGTNMGTGEVNQFKICTVECDGDMPYFCTSTYSVTTGVRPAMWVDIDMLVNN